MKMRCCVPFCNNTSENVSASEKEHAGISFHSFPSEEHLNAAWLIALGKQESLLPEPAVVCSQHFLSGDFYKTESGLRQIVPGAIPSTVQACMICLDTDGKLFLMNTNMLEEAYKQLTGYPLCDTKNLKHTLCAECAQRLMNFSRFRDKSLRARALLMDLAEKHELIARRHIKLINRTIHQLKSSMVSTTLAPDHCDLHIVEHPSQHSLRASQEAGNGATVKTEDTDDSMLDDKDQVMSENYYSYDQDPLKYDNARFQCTICLEEFVHAHEYTRHMSVHHYLQRGDNGDCEPRAAATSARPGISLGADDRQRAPQPSGEASPSAHSARTSVAEGESDSVQRNHLVKEIPNDDLDDESYVRNYTTNMNNNIFSNCVVKLYDIFSDSKKVVLSRDESLASGFNASPDIASTDCSYQPTVQSSECFEKDVTQGQPAFTCNSCRKTFKQKSLLAKHIKSHAGENRFTCNSCQYSCRCKSLLVVRTGTHMGKKPYSCKLCDYKSVSKSHLTRHMCTHTGKKPYSCKLCDYKSVSKSHLTRHMCTHTGEKSFSCNLCDHKSVSKSDMIKHTRTHTGEKPFSCKLCDHKSVRKFDMMIHTRTHTGEKPYSCNLCDFKSISKSHLTNHMCTHTGEKPFSCKLCDHKSVRKSDMIIHARTHTGEKPYSCKFCDYKSVSKSHLTRHMCTHRRKAILL